MTDKSGDVRSAVVSSGGAASAEPDSTVRPVQNVHGTWDAVDANGYGHALWLATRAECEAWIDGYDCGAEENM